MSTRVTVFNWNILAPMWIDISEYKSVNGDTNLLHEEKRLLLVIHRIRQSKADIITLQEVQKGQYETIVSELSDEYESLGLASHKLTYWSEWLAEGETPKENGQVTLVRKNMFKIVEKKGIQTTDDGNRLQIAVLQANGCNTNCITSSIILVNLHLESGMDDWKHETRKQQVSKIHEEVEKLINCHASLNPIPVLVGDFNTFGDQLGMQQVRHLRYVDVAEMLGQEVPTFIVVVDESYKVTLDHLVLRQSDVQEGRVVAKAFHVPDLTSDEYSQRNHKSVIIDALCDRLRRKGLSLADGLKSSDEALQILSHIPPSPPEFTESYALKALRVGSDHLPLYVELELQSI